MSFEAGAFILPLLVGPALRISTIWDIESLKVLRECDGGRVWIVFVLAKAHVYKPNFNS